MPNISQLSKYLKAEHVRDGDVITFMDAGNIVNKEFSKDGKSEFKDLLDICVDFKGERKTYTPNGTSVGLLSKSFGTATEGWVGRKARLFVVPSNNGKMMIMAKPMDGSVQTDNE